MRLKARTALCVASSSTAVKAGDSSDLRNTRSFDCCDELSEELGKCVCQPKILWDGC